MNQYCKVFQMVYKPPILHIIKVYVYIYRKSDDVSHHFQHQSVVGLVPQLLPELSLNQLITVKLRVLGV